MKKLPREMGVVAGIAAFLIAATLAVAPAAARSYQIPFRFDGKINKLTFKLGPSQLAADDQRKVEQAVARARD